MIQLLSDPKMRTYSNTTSNYPTVMGGVALPYQPMMPGGMPAAAMRPAAHHYIPPAMTGVTASVPTATAKSNQQVQGTAYNMVC